MEPYLEENIDDLLETIRVEEVIPTEDVKVVAVSEDGVNALLQEPGKKKGRKRQRPGERKTEAEAGLDSPTSYKNAVVGLFSLYGDVPADEKVSLRLQSRCVARIPEDRQESLAREVTFFKNNKSRVESKRFRDNGWPIGSGVIEAACKSIVKCRLCRSGMRWTRTGGQTILTLRTLVKSGHWEFFWPQYKTAHFTQSHKAATENRGHSLIFPFFV